MGIRGYVGHHRQREMFLCDQSALFAEFPVHKHQGLGFLFACLFVLGVFLLLFVWFFFGRHWLYFLLALRILFMYDPTTDLYFKRQCC